MTDVEALAFVMWMGGFLFGSGMMYIHMKKRIRDGEETLSA